MKNILLIIGNGFSIDLYTYLKLDIHSSSPFSFDIQNPFNTNEKLIDTLPRLKTLVEAQPNCTDFEMIQNFIDNFQKNDEEHLWTHSELRQYLSLAYSYAYHYSMSHWRNGWEWERWIKSNYKSLIGIVSFNYDLSLETVLKQSSINYHRIGSSEEDNPIGIPIFKPHGSCDFDFNNKGIHIPPQNRLGQLTFLNDYIVDGKGRVEIVEKGNLSEPRTESDIVLPFERSPQTNLVWVSQGYQNTITLAKQAEICIIVGISYQLCDRREIDIIIDAIPRNAEFRLVDPSPNTELEAKIKTVTNRMTSYHPKNFFPT